MAIRSPIIVNLGHVDHGKTSLTDYIRGSAVAKGEAGLITQCISSSYIPLETVKSICGGLLEKARIDFKVPGFLWVDSPGHEAFTTLRKRGGAIADLAVLVIDINEGFKPQTDESINFLKQFKTPFVVAATKIDRLPGWVATKHLCFADSWNEQPQRAQDELEKKLYQLVGQLSQRGFASERFDRVESYTKQIAIVPVSGITGEGVADLLVILAGVAQRFLKGELEVNPGTGKGTVLEVKEFKGLGATIDVIVYDGGMSKGDHLVIGSATEGEVVVTKVKALLKPKALHDIKTERDFDYVDSVTAADGVKVSAPGLEKVLSGSPIRSVSDLGLLEQVKKEIAAETLKGIGVSVRKAAVGNVNKQDVMEARSMKEPVVFAFCAKPDDDVAKIAKDSKVAVFSSDVIYRLVDGYTEWKRQGKQRAEDELLEKAIRPGRVRVLVGYVFRQRKPAVFGVEVVAGTIRPGYKLTKGGKVIGEIKELQKDGEGVDEAVSGDRVAVSLPDGVVGKDFSEGDVLDNLVGHGSIEILEKLKTRLRPDEKQLLAEIAGAKA